MFDWKHYVSLAESLSQTPIFDDGSDEKDGQIQASYRAAISRAYYGVFGMACAYLREIEKDTSVFESDRLHAAVINRLERKVEDGRKAGLRRGLRKVLSELRLRRTEADYRDGMSFNPNTVKKIIKDAKEAQNYADQLMR